MSTWRGPRPIATLIAGWIKAGAWAGAVVGIADVVRGWGQFAQFAPAVATRLRALTFTVSLYALAAGLAAGAVAFAGVLIGRYTRARLLTWKQGAHELAPPARLSVAIGVSLTCAAALAGVFILAEPMLAGRRHMGLVIASSMMLGAAALIGGGALGLVVGRAIEAAISAALPSRVVERLDRAEVIGPAVVLALGTVSGGAVAVTWSVSQHLPVDRGIALLALAAMTLALGPRLARERAFSGKRPPLVSALCVGAIVAVALFTGASEPVSKATSSYTALAGPISGTLRRLFDFDRDGFSGILAGGDCNDFDAETNPGAGDIPDDGRDQNCIGGDPKTADIVSAAPLAAPLPSSVPENLNVVLITIDTLRADHVGAYGYARATTPAIDDIAEGGALFENAWAHAPSTRYSIPAILTGRYPLSVYYDHSVSGWPGILPKGPNLASIMKASGRITGAVLNYWYFDTERSMDRDFDVYDNSNKRLHRGLPGKGPAETKGSSSKQQTDRAIRFIDNHAKSPFYLWVHYYDPHYSYETHPQAPDFGDRDVDRYDNEIAFTDSHIGRLVSALRERGLADRTAIVITGDHGEGFGEHGIDLHGYHLYAAQTKIPLILSIPGIAPSRPTAPAAHIDILPTLANLVGQPLTDEMQGRSLIPMLLDEAAARADGWVFQQLSYENNNEMRAAASQHCHVIYNVSPSSSWELYEIDADPDEAHDRIGDTTKCRGARAALERWYDASEIPAGAIEALVADARAPSDRLDLGVAEYLDVLDVIVPQTARRGEVVTVEYWFRAKKRLSDDWRLFAHFESQNGGRFTDDHEPTRPFSWWKSGDLVRYRRDVRVPKSARSGSYRLWVGVFRGSERLALSSSKTEIDDRRAFVAELEVR